MSDSTFGGSTGGSPQTFGASFGGGAAAVPGGNGADVTPAPSAPLAGFGAGLSKFFGNPGYTPPDPNASALDQTAQTLQQQVQRGNEVGSNFWTQMFHPEEAAKAREFALQKTQQLQEIKAQQQHAADVKTTARNWGLTNPDQFGDAATDTTLNNEALRQWKDEGNFNAYKALSGVSPEWKNRADLYMPDAMSKFAQHVDGVRKGIADLDKGAGTNSDIAYKAARDAVIKGNDLAALGIRPADIPATRQAWLARSGPLTAQYNQADRMVKSFQINQDRLNQAAPITDEKVAGQLEKNYQFGNGETMPGFHAVSLPGYGDVQGVMGPPGSRDTANRGVTWSNASPDQIKTVQEQLRADEVKGAIGKYKMARDFANTASNDKLYKSAAGLALISDELGAIGRDVAEGSKAAGSIGLTKMLEAKYGTIDNARNTLQKEYAALQEWLGKGGASNPRLSPPSIQGIKDVANFKHDEALKEVKDRVNQPLETAGRYGMLLKNMGLDKELTDSPELRGTYDNALKQGNREIDSYPMVAIGDRRVMLPTGSNVPGAKVAPLDHGPDQASVPPAQPAATQASVPPAPSGGSTTPPGTPVPGNPGGGGSPSGPTPPAPTGGPLPGRYGLPPGMALNTPQGLDALTNREIQLESGFKTGQRTGSYKGLSQWSDSEMQRHGITDPDDLGQNKRALTADAQRRIGILQSKGLPVTAANVYLMHQQGEAGLEAHLRNPDAPAWQNMAPYFKSQAIAKQAIWGNMTPEMKRQFPGGVDTVTSGRFVQLWDARVNGTDNGRNIDTVPGEGNASVANLENRRRGLAASGRTAPRAGEQTAPGAGGPSWPSPPISGGDDVNPNAPPINPGYQAEEAAKKRGEVNLGMIGGMAGSLAGPAGGLAGGAGGQALENYLRGEAVLQPNVVGSGAFGAAGGIATPGVAGAALRAGTAAAGGGAQGGFENGVPGALVGAVEGGGGALFGEGAGRVLAGAANAIDRFGGFLGMGGHQTFSRLTEAAQKAYLDAANVFAKGAPEKPAPLFGGGKNVAAEKAYEEKLADYEDAERHLKAVMPHVKPEEAAYAAQQVGNDKGEAVTGRPLAEEKADVQKGLNDVRKQVADQGAAKGIVSVKPRGALPDGPLSQLRTADNPGGKIPNAEGVETALQNAEMLATAPAPNGIAQRWDNILKARSELLEQERTALGGASPDPTKAKALRAGADALLPEVERVADGLFGKEGAQQVMGRMKVLWARYQRVMSLSEKGDVVDTIAQGGKNGRDAKQAFNALAADDPTAQRVVNALVRLKKGVPWQEVGLMVPVIGGEIASGAGHVVSSALAIAKLTQVLHDFIVRRGAGQPVKMDTILNKGRAPAVDYTAAGRAGAAAGGREGASVGVP